MGCGHIQIVEKYVPLFTLNIHPHDNLFFKIHHFFKKMYLKKMYLKKKRCILLSAINRRYNVSFLAVYLLRSAVAGRLYKHQCKHTSNSGFNCTIMPFSGYILFAAEQRVGYQISWVDLQREVNCP